MVPEALDRCEQLRGDFDVKTPLPEGEFRKLVQTAESTRCAIMLYQLFKMDGDQSSRIQAEVKDLRGKTKSNEKDLLPAPMCKKIVKVLWK